MHRYCTDPCGMENTEKKSHAGPVWYPCIRASAMCCNLSDRKISVQPCQAIQGPQPNVTTTLNSTRIKSYRLFTLTLEARNHTGATNHTGPMVGCDTGINPGGIYDSGLSLNRYLQAHPGDTGKCPSKLTAYISIVPDKDVLRTYMYMSVDIYSLP